ADSRGGSDRALADDSGVASGLPMYLYVTARQFELTEGLRNYVEQRLVRSARNHANPHDLQRMEVQLYKVGEGEPRFGCHVLLHMPGQKDINIREEALDLYEAIDGADKR